MIDASRGKSAYAVLAASIKIRNVPISSSQNITPLPPKMYSAIRPNPLPSCSPRNGFSLAARIDTPKKHVPRMTPIQTSVVAAFLLSGFLKAGTPFEIASMPDRATAPDEKARSSM